MTAEQKLEMIETALPSESFTALIMRREQREIFNMLMSVLNDFTFGDVYQTHIEHKKSKAVLRQMVYHNQI
jgi:hypothetical protein